MTWYLRLFCRISNELKKETQLFTLHHINIVAFLAIICESGQYGVVMEYVHHGVLNDVINNYKVCISYSAVFMGSVLCYALFMTAGHIIQLMIKYHNSHKKVFLMTTMTHHIQCYGKVYLFVYLSVCLSHDSCVLKQLNLSPKVYT